MPHTIARNSSWQECVDKKAFLRLQVWRCDDCFIFTFIHMCSLVSDMFHYTLLLTTSTWVWISHWHSRSDRYSSLHVLQYHLKKRATVRPDDLVWPGLSRVGRGRSNSSWESFEDRESQGCRVRWSINGQAKSRSSLGHPYTHRRSLLCVRKSAHFSSERQREERVSEALERVTHSQVLEHSDWLAKVDDTSLHSNKYTNSYLHVNHTYSPTVHVKPRSQIQFWNFSLWWVEWVSE